VEEEEEEEEGIPTIEYYRFCFEYLKAMNEVDAEWEEQILCNASFTLWLLYSLESLPYVDAGHDGFSNFSRGLGFRV